VTGVVSIVVKRRDTGHALERQRSALLDSLHAESAAFSAGDRDAVTRDEALVLSLARVYDGDLIDADVAQLASPIVYVHGAIEGFSHSAGIEKTARASVKDAFVLCLLDPPRSRTEALILKKVRTAYTTGVVAPNIHRLADAYIGLRVLQPAWEDRVRAAHDDRELVTLEAELHRTPLDAAKQTLRANLLLAVMDEPGDPNTAAELDGERAHYVRVGLFDVATGKALIRARERVDPTAWSQGSRTDYARGLDECALAVDLRERVKR
jgi:hypothetical protein